MGSCAGIIQSGENTRRALVLDQRAHHLVVKVLDRSPLDLLAGILILFCLESQLNENLLQLFVDIVDTQLFERVLLKNFESINIQDTNRIGDRTSSSQRLIDTLYNPIEQIEVNSLGQGIPNG